MREAEHSTGLVPAVTCLSWSGITYERPGEPGSRSGPRTVVNFDFPVSYLLAGVDPKAEAELFGLGTAVTEGRYLTSRAPARMPPRPDGNPSTALPMFLSERSANDPSVSVASTRRGDERPLLRERYDAEARRFLYTVGEPGEFGTTGPGTTGPGTFERAADGTLRPRPAERTPLSDTVLPLDGQDIWFRPLLPQGPKKESGLALPQIVGTFDPERQPEFDAASRLPLGTYGEPALAAADTRSRALLAIPVALAVTVASGAVPAWLAACSPG